MSDDAIGWDDFGGEDQVSRLLPPAEYAGTITVAQWAHADWAAKKHPESGGKILKVKIEIDAPAGYAEAWTTVPVIKERGWQFRVICAAAGVEAPSKDGPKWSPAGLVGKRVQVMTKVYTNPRTDESKVEVEKWLPAEGAAKSEAVEPKAAEPAKRSRSAQPATVNNDDIPF